MFRYLHLLEPSHISYFLIPLSSVLNPHIQDPLPTFWDASWIWIRLTLVLLFSKYRKINDFFFPEPGECAGEEGGESVRGGEGQEEGSLHPGEELPGQALPLQAQDDEGGKLPLGKHSSVPLVLFFSYVGTMQRLDQSSLHPSFKYSYTDMSRLGF
jgi:hypothetical protein